ncbi:hypothetical protein EYF80_054812 [Liparis tanakae]|uniref:Uncharacterized protein n=1 Tax=Liparis tanakae TaxID=230148 RepID=A0A4Z2F1M0_9TELE|nr:hypothetical protein EYF80_054812 [Liparis tanakae]
MIACGSLSQKDQRNRTRSEQWLTPWDNKQERSMFYAGDDNGCACSLQLQGRASAPASWCWRRPTGAARTSLVPVGSPMRGGL